MAVNRKVMGRFEKYLSTHLLKSCFLSNKNVKEFFLGGFGLRNILDLVKKKNVFFKSNGKLYKSKSKKKTFFLHFYSIENTISIGAWKETFQIGP